VPNPSNSIQLPPTLLDAPTEKMGLISKLVFGFTLYFFWVCTHYKIDECDIHFILPFPLTIISITCVGLAFFTDLSGKLLKIVNVIPIKFFM